MKTHASFGDSNLVLHAGLVPVMALAQRAGLADLIGRHVRPGGECGVSAAVKVPCLVAGMTAAGLRAPQARRQVRARQDPGEIAAGAGAERAGRDRQHAAVAARTARHSRGHLTLHLPDGWHREQEWLNLPAACGRPAAAA